MFDPESKTFDSVNQVGGATVYYLQRNTNSSVKLHAFPPGFRMIAGSPGLKTFSDTLEQRAISYACIDYNHPSPETHSLPTTNCPQGLRSQVFFPSCWDGVNLDSTDHKSHVSYLSNVDSGVCPPTHPVQLISIFYEVMWDIDSIKDRLGHSNSNLVWSTDDSTGYSFHGDFQNGWDVAVLQNAIDQCTNLSGLVEDCPAFQLRPGGYERQCPTKKLTPETVLGKGLASIPYSCGAIYSPGVASLCSASSMTSPPLSIPTSSLVAPKSIPPSSNVLVPDSSSVISYRNTIPSPTSKKCRRRQF